MNVTGCGCDCCNLRDELVVAERAVERVEVVRDDADVNREVVVEGYRASLLTTSDKPGRKSPPPVVADERYQRDAGLFPLPQVRACVVRIELRKVEPTS